MPDSRRSRPTATGMPISETLTLTECWRTWTTLQRTRWSYYTFAPTIRQELTPLRSSGSKLLTSWRRRSSLHSLIAHTKDSLPVTWNGIATVFATLSHVDLSSFAHSLLPRTLDFTVRKLQHFYSNCILQFILFLQMSVLVTSPWWSKTQPSLPTWRHRQLCLFVVTIRILQQMELELWPTFCLILSCTLNGKSWWN